MPNLTAAGVFTSPRRTLRMRLLAPALGLLAAGAALVATPEVASAQTPPAGQAKFAVIDMRRAILETEEGLRVQATLKKLFDSRQVELDNKQRQLLQEKEDLDKDQQSGKAKEGLQRRVETWQRQAAELQTLMVEYQKEMQRKESEMTTPILAKVAGLLKRIAAQDGFEVILEKSAAPYFRSDLEITDRAIQLYNGGAAGEPAKGDKKAPAAPAKGAPAAPAAPKSAPKK